MMGNKIIKLLFCLGLCFPLVGIAGEAGSAGDNKKSYTDCIAEEKSLDECTDEFLTEMYADIDSLYAASKSKLPEQFESEIKWWSGRGIWTPTPIDLLDKEKAYKRAG